MEENEINKRLRKTENYLGTYSIDELNSLKISLYPSFLVVNLDIRENSGTHWIALALYCNDIFICDSLGTLVLDRFPSELVNFIHLITFNKILHITKQLQSYNSENCGKFFILFVKTMSCTNNFSRFLSNFSQNFFLNDCIISLLNNS